MEENWDTSELSSIPPQLYKATAPFLHLGFKCKSCHGASCIDRVVKAPFSSQLLAQHRGHTKVIKPHCPEGKYETYSSTQDKYDPVHWRVLNLPEETGPIFRPCPGLQVSSTAGGHGKMKAILEPEADLIVLFTALQSSALPCSLFQWGALPPVFEPTKTS